MKASRYNRFFQAENNGHWLAFNAMTGALATLDDEEKYLLVQQVLANPDQVNREDEAVQELWDPLIEGGYLVEDWVDEITLLKIRNRTGRFQNYGLYLTIAPTMNCNFKCTYCYQTHPNETMNQEVEKALVEMIRDRLRPKESLRVTWYGGEPLLCQDQIIRLSGQFAQICQEQGSSYEADMVTNGYLLNEPVARQLRLAHVLSMQITLDGPREIHDKRRLLCNGRGTYEHIMTNLQEILAHRNADSRANNHYPGVTIRVNVDQTNISEVCRLLDDLEERELKDRLHVYTAPVRPYTDICSSIGGSCLSEQDYTAAELNLCRQFLSRGFRSVRYPRPTSVFCMAHSCLNAFVVAPSGELYGCWNDIGNEGKIIGHLLEKRKAPYSPQRLIEYLSWDPFEREVCLECDVLPICKGGCPYQGLRVGLDDRGVCCLTWKENLVEMLQLFYTSRAWASHQ